MQEKAVLYGVADNQKLVAATYMDGLPLYSIEKQLSRYSGTISRPPQLIK